MKKSGWLIGGCSLAVLIGSSLIGADFWLTNRKRTIDTATAHHLKNAITSFVLEYERVPVSGGRQHGDVDFSSDLEFMEIISGAETATKQSHNPRAIAFFTDYPGKKKYRYGRFFPTRHRVIDIKELYDSYGNLYQVRIDANADERVSCPATRSLIKEQVLIWSAGKDRKLDTWQDNVTTWDS